MIFRQLVRQFIRSNTSRKPWLPVATFSSDCGKRGRRKWRLLHCQSTHYTGRKYWLFALFIDKTAPYPKSTKSDTYPLLAILYHNMGNQKKTQFDQIRQIYSPLLFDHVWYWRGSIVVIIIVRVNNVKISNVVFSRTTTSRGPWISMKIEKTRIWK